MTDDIRRAFEKALPESLPPSTWDSHELEKRARRSLLQHRIGYAGGALSVVLAAALALPVVVPGSAPADGPAASQQQPEFPLPELDNDSGYAWDSKNPEGEDSKASLKINDAFWKHMGGYEGLSMQNFQNPEDSAPLAEANVHSVTRVENFLRPADKGAPVKDDSGEVYLQPNYALMPADNEKQSVFNFENSEVSDMIDMRVVPKGGFAEGRPATSSGLTDRKNTAYLAENCDEFDWEDGDDSQAKITFECDSRGVAEGSVLTTERTHRYSDGHVTVHRSAVLYRDDGTAVVVEDSPHTTSPSDAEATLSVKELTKIAQAIPDVIVK